MPKTIVGKLKEATTKTANWQAILCSQQILPRSSQSVKFWVLKVCFWWASAIMAQNLHMMIWTYVKYIWILNAYIHICKHIQFQLLPSIQHLNSQVSNCTLFYKMACQHSTAFPCRHSETSSCGCSESILTMCTQKLSSWANDACKESISPTDGSMDKTWIWIIICEYVYMYIIYSNVYIGHQVPLDCN